MAVRLVRLLPRFTIVEWFVVLVVCGILSTFAYDDLQARLGARDGRTDGDADVAADTLRLKHAGKPPHCRNHMTAIFQERFSVSLEYIGGCCPSSYRRAYNSAYNDRMHTAIQIRDPTFDPVASYNEVREFAMARQEADRNARE